MPLFGPTQLLGPRERQALIESGAYTAEDFGGKTAPHEAHLMFQHHTELVFHAVADMGRQRDELHGAGAPQIDQHQRLLLMDGGTTDGKPLETALIDEPASRQLGLPFCRRVAGHLRVLLFQGLGQGGGHHRVFEETARVAQHRRIRQLGHAGGTDGVENGLWRRGIPQRRQRAIAGDRAPCLGQAQTDGDDEVGVLIVVLEDAVTVTEPAVGRRDALGQPPDARGEVPGAPRHGGL